MSGEVLLFPGCGHNPQDIIELCAVLGLEARIATKDGPPRIKLVAQTPKPNSQISPGPAQPWYPARSSGQAPAAPMAGGYPPHLLLGSRRRLFSNHHSPRRRP